MLLQAKLVHVPARPEIDADLAEYGHIGAKCRACYGCAAVEAGAPDHEVEDAETGATDAIANILHWYASEDEDASARRVLDRALMHFEAEVNGEDEDVCPRCGAERMEDQTGPAGDWCGCRTPGTAAHDG